MPSYDHICTDCQHEWNDFYSINDAVPSICPGCNKEGCVKRLISGIPMVKVPLTGQDLKNQINEDTRKARERIKTDEKFKANIMGEDKYQAQVISDEKFTEKYKNI